MNLQKLDDIAAYVCPHRAPERQAMTNEERNRRIAEWLESEPNRPPYDHEGSISADKVWRFRSGRWHPCNFLHDEAANALLLEAMPEPRLIHRLDKLWVCVLRECSGSHADRKEAVVMAFEAFMERNPR